MSATTRRYRHAFANRRRFLSLGGPSSRAHSNASEPASPTGTNGTLHRFIPTDQAWRAAKDKLASELPAIRAFKGTLGSVAAEAGRRARTHQPAVEGLQPPLCLREHDVRPGHARQHLPGRCSRRWRSLARRLARKPRSSSPRFSKLDPAKIDTFISSEPRLKVYSFYLHDILRRRAHTLSDSEEKILANASVVASAPSDTYGILVGCRLRISDRHAQRRQERQAR